MVFSSIIFLFYFLPLFMAAFFLLGRSKIVILVFSLIFYAWGEPVYVLLMLASIAVNYRLGVAIEDARETARDRLILTVGIILNLLPLLVFKYGVFIVDNLERAIGFRHLSHWQVVLPLGISFYTFHSISYLIDVYRRDTPAERKLLDLAVYITMFPQLVSGPIIRYKTIAQDIHHPNINVDLVALGIRTFIIGLAQKVFIANTVAVPADMVFSLPVERLSTVDSWIGIASYTLQIYYDFNGYSTMAIGLGLMLGYRFPQNFNYPYISKSITEFWRRWHISLSQWFRDYVYIPLGGNRGRPAKTYANLVIVFVLCGIWHGAAWTFLVWGLYHGLFLAIERMGMSALLQRLPSVVRVGYALLVVMVGWVLFRADSFHQAAIYLAAMAGFGAPHDMGIPVSRLLHNDVILAFAAGLAFAGPALGRWFTSFDGTFVAGAQRWAGGAALMLLLFAASMSLAGGVYNPFIYFRF